MHGLDAFITQQADGRVYIPVKNSWAVSARLEPGTSLGDVTQFLDFELKPAEINMVTLEYSVEQQTN